MAYKSKIAQKEYNRRYYLEHRDTALRRAAEYKKAHPEAVAASQKRHRLSANKRNKRYYYFRHDRTIMASRRAYIRKTHGISREEYYQRLADQNSQCAICRCVLKSPQLDHNHVTGELRKFLCLSCNTGLGQFKDSVTLLREAAIYLESHEDKLT